MTPKQFYRAKPKEHIEAVCEKAGTSFGNFKQIAIASGSVSSKLALKLEEASDGQMTLREILFPADAEEEIPKSA